MLITGLLFAAGWFLFSLLMGAVVCMVSFYQTSKEIQAEAAESSNRHDVGTTVWFDREEQLRQKRLQKAGLK